MISVPRTTIRGPRIAFVASKIHCCELCVFGRGEHSDTCDKRELYDVRTGEIVSKEANRVCSSK
jgi:hypothetical protein